MRLLGRLPVIRAELAGTLDYLWRSTTGNIMARTELFRLIRRLETVKNRQHAVCHMLRDPEWTGLRQLRINTDICAVPGPH